MKPGRTINIVDTTLRDGEQSPGIAFATQDKLQIATALDQAGVGWIEVGMPIMGDEEQEAIKSIINAKLQAKILAWNRALREDIIASIACGCSFLHISVPVSDLHIEQKIKKSRAWVLNELAQAMQLARSFGCTISVGAEDASRADTEFFLQVADVAAKLGAVHIRYADTVGCLTPFSVAERFKTIIPRCPLPIEVHMHNDFGLATANTIVALQGGAQLASTTVAGLGERAGNAALEEVVKALHSLYGMKTGIDEKCFHSLSQLVMQASGRNVFSYKAVIGSAFM